MRCPQCGSAAAWGGNPHRPFCSLACRLIDLGVWLDERYRIAGPEFPSEPGSDEGAGPGGG
ncbi:MAG TPA: DNA gyrase inhibitor YacG [Methylomirabilota bacterium]|nr:DNA gyrase inhibitor YacG [Methylomirabilota bacterium]